MSPAVRLRLGVGSDYGSSLGVGSGSRKANKQTMFELCRIIIIELSKQPLLRLGFFFVGFQNCNKTKELLC